MQDLFENLDWNKKMEVLRVMNNWTQMEAAERCFTVQKAYWSWEAGKVYPRKNSRRAIARAFSVKEEEIFKA
ncbi:DNA-binding transcriptional regulator, XRE-family HTH domain [Clostridium collagenovorans DSM 3089]|uniref:DNA-binding transcriptional regulator, XRE-family HTH domain n=1 Tax=Clostridium collagenovorans DSM 3089 TaxID=1121306 RepID=A0A1M5XP15_9CLOT|nr:helix-turn-helix transcriptional regulator [Clostridium collagenovorans]SHI01489.1 DNA-binding transcriptional regulator, XRE-family HTH domain [Clostridium collagenovorans DSM 3089]